MTMTFGEHELTRLRAENRRLKQELRRYKEEVRYEVVRAANEVLGSITRAELTVEDETARALLKARRDKEESTR